MRSFDLLTDAAKEKIGKLPFCLRYVAGMLVDGISEIIDGKCSEEEIARAAGTLQNNAECRFSKYDLLTYDEAGEILGFGKTNRVGLKHLLDKHGIKQVIFGKSKMGFKRSDILALKEEIEAKRKMTVLPYAQLQ